MKQKLRFLVVIALAVTTGTASLHAQEEKKETLGDKLKKLFVRPTPTPTPRKKHKAASPSATETANSPSSASPQESATAAPASTETTLPVTTVTPPAEPQSTAETQYFEAVRPISPGPRTRPHVAPRTIPAPETSPIASATAISESTPDEIPEPRPMPSLPQMISPSESPIAPSASFSVKWNPTPNTKKTPSPAISIEGISNSSGFSAAIRKIVDIGLDLTARNLGYKYASADPAKGGMDCSGFIYYVLTESGVESVPRDAREQYIWVRKAGNFQAVLAQRDDTFELDSLKPGDLLFWASNFGVSREPEITQTMIYIGRDKATNQRLMVGASENGTFEGEKKSGVGIFDFTLGSSEPKTDDEPTSVFVGYGHIPNIVQ